MNLRKFLGLIVLTLVAGVAMAAGEDVEGATTGASLFTPAFSMAIAASICALGQGKGTAAACEATARNPGAAGDIRTTMIIGLALIESLAIYTLVVIFAV